MDSSEKEKTTQEDKFVVDNTSVGDDPGAVVNENLKEVEINYTPPSRFKVFLLVLLFVVLIAFVIFLPDITKFVDAFKAGELTNKEEVKITTGRLNCSLSTNTANLDKKYDVTFNFTDNQLEYMEYNITTRGNANLDEEVLDELNAYCKQLEDNVVGMNGVTIRCDYTNSQLVESQSFNLVDVDIEALDSAFIEAGGNYPEYKYGQDIDNIEKNMLASGYTCNRESK